MTPVPCRGGAPASGRDRNPAVLGPSGPPGGVDRTGVSPITSWAERWPEGTNRGVPALLVQASRGLAAESRPRSLENLWEFNYGNNN